MFAWIYFLLNFLFLVRSWRGSEGNIWAIPGWIIEWALAWLSWNNWLRYRFARFVFPTSLTRRLPIRIRWAPLFLNAFTTYRWFSPWFWWNLAKWRKTWWFPICFCILPRILILLSKLIRWLLNWHFLYSRITSSSRLTYLI